MFNSLFAKIIGLLERRRWSDDNDLRHPYRDWERILLVSAIAIVVAVAADGYLFYKISKNEMASETQATEVSETINRKALKDMVTHYDNKESSFANLKQTGSAVIDQAL